MFETKHALWGTPSGVYQPVQSTPCPHSVRLVAVFAAMTATQIHSQQNTRAHHLHLQKAAADFEAITYPRGSILAVSKTVVPLFGHWPPLT